MVSIRGVGEATSLVSMLGRALPPVSAFFARHESPNLSLGRTTAAQIERMFSHAEEPSLPTDFD